MTKLLLSIHAHFYQPPRAHPLTGTIGSERGAAPYRNWNERAAEEVYRPNAKIGNFEHLSFDISEDLLAWLLSHAPETYQRITSSVQMVRRAEGIGNAMAAPLYQAPLTLFSERDRLSQLIWGGDAAETRFGYRPKGVFLPFFAVDDATLQSVADAGFSYTVLRSSQVRGLKARGGAGPYRVTLSSGDSLAVFVSDDTLSKGLLNEMVERGGAGYWARHTLASYFRHAGPLNLVCLEGELVGKHHMAEAIFLHYLAKHEAPGVAFQPVSLEQYFHNSPQTIGEIEVIPTPAEDETEVQTMLRSIVNYLCDTVDPSFEKALGKDAWALRDRAMVQNIATEFQPWIETQMALKRAEAGICTLDYYPQLSIAHVLNELAYAVVLAQSQTRLDLQTPVHEMLPEAMGKSFASKVDEMQMGVTVKASVR